MQERTALLASVPLFASLPAEALEGIASRAEEIEAPAGAVLTHEGRHEGYFYVVVASTVGIERNGVVVDTIGPGGELGEISLIDDGPRTATARTQTPSILLRLTNRDFDDLLAEHPGIRDALEAQMASRLERIDAEAR